MKATPIGRRGFCRKVESEEWKGRNGKARDGVDEGNAADPQASGHIPVVHPVLTRPFKA